MDSKIVELKISCIPSRLRMATHTVDAYVSPQIQRYGIWEPFETEVMIRHLHAGDSVIDVGANIGYYSLIAATIVGQTGRVFSFEPETANVELLQFNVLLNNLNNVFVHPCGVSDQTGTGYLYLSYDNLGDHRMYKSMGPDEPERLRLPVQVIDLDSFIDMHGISPNLVKIDSQGMEAHILRGMKCFLKRQRGKVTLFIELWPYGLANAGSKPMDVLASIEELDPEIWVIDEHKKRLLLTSTQQLSRLIEGKAFVEQHAFLNLLIRPKDCR